MPAPQCSAAAVLKPEGTGKLVPYTPEQATLPSLI